VCVCVCARVCGKERFCMFVILRVCIRVRMCELVYVYA